MNEFVQLLSKGRGTSQTAIITWGEVISVSPTEVRFAGDTADVEVELYLSSYTPTTNDRVLLIKVGETWVIIGDIV
jgi:hypothetical protein